MGVKIISKEMIKPSDPKLDHIKPYNLSLFDQLTPNTYAPVILFYPFNESTIHQNLMIMVMKLKTSLSETLNIFYPFSGRVRNNVSINGFEAGVPFSEARVDCSMSEFLKLLDIEQLNQFIPLHPFCKIKEVVEEEVPNIAIQVNIFTCGGIAIGISLCHKMADGATVSLLLKSWVAIFRGSYSQIKYPNLPQGSALFPPRNTLPQNYISLTESFWFKSDNYVTKRFVFSPMAISTLRAKAQSETVPKPSRTETLTCFIWKHMMAASIASSGMAKTSIIAQAVNMRPRMKPSLSDEATGNLFWWASVAANTGETGKELHQLMGLMNESLAGLDSEYFESLKGEDGFDAVCEYYDQLLDMFSGEKPEIFAFTSWIGFFYDIDFGWGLPFWIAPMGRVGPAFRNLTVFTESKWSGGIEAWVTLEKNQMDVLENDSAFLAFASPNPLISAL